MVSWDTQSDWDESVDSSGVAHESVTNTDRNDATVAAHGYSYTSPPLTNGLVGHWPLHDDSAQDLSGNGNHGTLNGGVTTGVAGKGGLEAMGADGTDDVVVIGDDSALDLTGDRTVSMWFRSPNVSGNAHPVLQKGGYAASEGDYTYWMGPFSNDTTYFRVSDGSNHIVDLQYTTSNYLSDDTWHHLVWTWDGTTDTDGIKAYVDGTQVSTATATSTNVKTSTEKVRLFSDEGSSAGSFHYMQGNLCDVRIYNRALSDAEIRELYEWGNADLATPRTDGVSRYALNGDATDSWGSNDGTTNGGLSFSSDAIRGQSGDFDGTDDYIDIGTPPSLDFTASDDFTVSCWIKSDEWTSDRHHIISTRSGGGNALYLWAVDSTDFRWTVTGDSNKNEVIVNPPPTGEWIHVVGVHRASNNEVELYFNAVSQATESNSSLTGSVVTNWALGRRSNDSFPRYYDGHLDDVRIYDFALDPWEVHELYQWGTFGRDLRGMTVRQ